MTATEERTKVEANDAREHGVRRWIVAVVGVVALGVGFLVGTLIDGGDDQVRDDDVATVIRPDGGDLTDRQADMVDTTNDAVAGWQAADGDRVASHMTPDGRLEYLLEDTVYFASDRSLQDVISRYGVNFVQPVGPMVVSRDRVVVFGTHPLGEWLTIFQFSGAGEVEVIGVYHL